MKKKVVVVVPTYNESGTIKQLIEKIIETSKSLKDKWSIEILVVDSYSQDGTGDIVRELKKHNNKIHLLEMKKEGLGKAYALGFNYALEKINPYVLFSMDADFSHDPKDIPRFLEKIEKGADFVVGSRYIKGGSIPRNWGIDRKLYSIVGNLIIKFGLMRLKVTDWTSGYRCVKAWVVRSIIDHIKSFSGYVFQIAYLDNALKAGAKVVEVPIHFRDRIYGISKIDVSQYGRNTIEYVIKNSSFIKFGVVGGIGFFIDFGSMNLMLDLLHIPTSIITFMSASLAVISNYILNNSWSFAHKKVSDKFSLLKGFVSFAIISLGSVILQTTGVYLFELIFMPPSDPNHQLALNIFRLVFIITVIIPYSYFLYNRFVWKDK